MFWRGHIHGNNWEGGTRVYATIATIERKKGAIFLLQNLVTPPPVDHVFVAVVWLKKIIALMMDHAKLLSQMNFSFLCIVVSLYCVLLLAAIVAFGSSLLYISLDCNSAAPPFSLLLKKLETKLCLPCLFLMMLLHRVFFAWIL